MKHQIKKLPKSEVELEVSVSNEEMETFWKIARKKITEGIQMKGFRPGKAPSSVLAGAGIEEDIHNEAANSAINKTYPEILEKEGIEPIGRVNAEVIKLAPNNEFIYKLKFFVLPEINLPNYKEIAKEIIKNKKKAEVKKEEIEKAIDWLRKSRAELINVERGAKNGDLVEVDIESLAGDKKMEKASGEEKFVLGEGNFLPGFEKQIEGMKKNEEKEFDIIAPGDYWDESLRGQKLSFKVKMKEVNERKLPEKNDEWAKKVGNFKNFQELEKSIEEGILAEKDLKERDKIRVQMMEKLLVETKIDLPEILVENEIHYRLHELEHMAQDAGLSLDDYLQKAKKDKKSVETELRKESEKTVNGMLILKEISKRENCVASEEEIEAAMAGFLARFGDLKEAEKKIDRQALRGYTEERLINEKVFLLLENL
jgi:trigger factor